MITTQVTHTEIDGHDARVEAVFRVQRGESGLMTDIVSVRCFPNQDVPDEVVEQLEIRAIEYAVFSGE